MTHSPAALVALFVVLLSCSRSEAIPPAPLDARSGPPSRIEARVETRVEVPRPDLESPPLAQADPEELPHRTVVFPPPPPVDPKHKAVLERLVNAEVILREPSGRSPDEIRKMRRSLEVLAQDADGDDLKTRIRDQREIVDRALLASLRKEAKALAAGGPSKVRAAMTAYAKVEDEAESLLDGAMEQEKEEAKGYFTREYKEILDESNAFVTATFTPDYRERTPWTDLLSDGRRGHWGNAGVQGFNFEHGGLSVFGPRTGSSMNGLITIGEAGGLRDFEVEMEFTLEGTIDLLFRLGHRVDDSVEFYTLSTAGQEPLTVGRIYTLRATYIGSALEGSVTPDDTTLPAFESHWTKSRKGDIGIQMHEASVLKISRLRVRELRNG